MSRYTEEIEIVECDVPTCGEKVDASTLNAKSFHFVRVDHRVSFHLCERCFDNALPIFQFLSTPLSIEFVYEAVTNE